MVHSDARETLIYYVRKWSIDPLPRVHLSGTDAIRKNSDYKHLWPGLARRREDSA